MAIPPHSKLLVQHFDACLGAAKREEVTILFRPAVLIPYVEPRLSLPR